MLKQDFTHFEKWHTRLLYSALFLLCSFPLFASLREAPATFATPDEAIQAIVQAAETNDTRALLRLFGPTGGDIVESGDPAEDKAMRSEFVRLAHEKIAVRIDAEIPDKANVAIGPQAWPFPIPLVRINGRWQFDLAQGRAAILAHRIGENEVDVIEVCRGFVEAELDYASDNLDGTGLLAYAQKIKSSPGQRDGLSWESELPSLVPKALAEATAISATDRAKAPYHGYYFRILKSQGPHARGGAVEYVVNGKMIGGFALIAWPAEYGVSGIKTFIVNHDGIVYEKDLGANTGTSASRISRFDPDDSWRQLMD